MPAHRTDRVNGEMLREMADILRSVKDPRVSGGFLSVVACNVSKDFKFAKIYYSLLGGDPADTQKGLISASGFIRREIASRLNLRVTPELTFIHDNSIEHGAKITNILRGLDIKDEE